MEIKNFPVACWKRSANCCIMIYVIRKHATYYRKIKIGEMIMSKLKKKAFAVILGGALSVMSCLPVFAAESGISPHVPVAPCPQCYTGTLYKYTTEKPLYNVTENGVTKTVYEVTVTSECNNCSYRNSSSHKESR